MFILAQQSNSNLHYLQVMEVVYAVMKAQRIKYIRVDFLPVTIFKKVDHVIYNRYHDKKFNTNIGTIHYYFKHKIIPYNKLLIPKYILLTIIFQIQYLSSKRVFMKASYKGVKFSKYICSHEIRYNNNSTGVLNSIYYIHKSLIKALSMIDYIMYNIDAKEYEYTCIMEKYYLFGIYEIVPKLCNANIKPLEFDGRGRLLRREYNENEYLDNIDLVNEYINMRANNPFYMARDRFIENDNFAYPINEGNITVVIYVHSFIDAQYKFKHDGYIDLYDWLTSSIKILNKNDNNNVYIKDHPDAAKYPKHIDLLNSISQKYNVDVLSHNYSVRSFLDTPNYIGLTHHGTVIEDHAIHGMPIIYYKYGFTEEFDICISWSTPSEYHKILTNIHLYINNKPDTLELKRYIYYQYILNRRGFRNTIVPRRKDLSLKEYEHFQKVNPYEHSKKLNESSLEF